MQWDMVHVAVALFLLFSTFGVLTSSYWELRKYGLIMKILIINGSSRKQGTYLENAAIDGNGSPGEWGRSYRD